MDWARANFRVRKLNLCVRDLEMHDLFAILLSKVGIPLEQLTISMGDIPPSDFGDSCEEMPCRA